MGGSVSLSGYNISKWASFTLTRPERPNHNRKPLSRPVPYPLWKQFLLGQEATLVYRGIVVSILQRQEAHHRVRQELTLDSTREVLETLILNRAEGNRLSRLGQCNMP